MRSRNIRLVLWIVVLGVLPAWANNPPQPDGLFSIILIIPVVILGFRLAGAKYTDRERKWRILRGLLFALAILLAMAGTSLAALPLIGFLIYGIGRAVQIGQRGQGTKRIFISAFVFLFTLFAVGDYFVSLAVETGPLMNETQAVARSRTIAVAEKAFAESSGQKDKPKYATMDELVSAGLLDRFAVANYRGYQFVIAVSEDRSNFWVTATPLNYRSGRQRMAYIPGESWLRTFGHDKFAGSRSFAVDESGVIRYTESQVHKLPTREEIQSWQEL